MCIYCLITCKCIGHIYYIKGYHLCSIRTLVAIYVSPRIVGLTLVDNIWDVWPL